MSLTMLLFKTVNKQTNKKLLSIAPFMLRLYFLSPPRLPKLPSPLEYHYQGSLGNAGSNKEIQPMFLTDSVSAAALC